MVYENAPPKNDNWYTDYELSDILPHRKTITGIPFTTEYQKKSQPTVTIPISSFT